jgi:DnaJ-class molecular chaperone
MDHYATLGLTKNASIDEIKKAYRQLAKKWHPDKNNGSKEAEEKFKSISDAYAILSDPEKKKQYDLKNSDYSRFGFDDFVNSFSGSQFNDWRKRSNDRAKQTQGRTHAMPKLTTDHLDITINYSVSMREAFEGTKIELEFTRDKIMFDSVKQYFIEKEEKTVAFNFDLKNTPITIKKENGRYSTVVRLASLGNEEMKMTINLWGEPEKIPLCGDALIRIEFEMESNILIEEKDVIHRVEVPFFSSIIENQKVKVDAINGKKYEASLNYPKNLSKIEFSIQNEGLAITKTERGKYVVKIEVILSNIEEMTDEIKAQIKTLFEPAKE